MVDRQDHLRPMEAKCSGEIAAKRKITDDQTILMVEERHIVDADNGTTRALFFLAHRADDLWCHRGNPGLAPRHQHIADVLALRRPACHRGRSSIFHVVGMCDDSKRPTPILWNQFEADDPVLARRLVERLERFFE